MMWRFSVNDDGGQYVFRFPDQERTKGAPLLKKFFGEKPDQISYLPADPVSHVGVANLGSLPGVDLVNLNSRSAILHEQHTTKQTSKQPSVTATRPHKSSSRNENPVNTESSNSATPHEYKSGPILSSVRHPKNADYRTKEYQKAGKRRGPHTVAYDKSLPVAKHEVKLPTPRWSLISSMRLPAQNARSRC